MNKNMTTIMTMLLFVGVAAAATTVDHYWSGAGYTNVSAQAGDDHDTYFESAGSAIQGDWHFVDSDDNPYGYNVDTVKNWKKATVNGGGYIWSWTTRDDSKASSYGNPGQKTETMMQTDDGALDLGWYSWTNFAEMGNCQYGATKPKTASGKNFEASGSNYQMWHKLTDADGDGAMWTAYGSGSSEVKLQGEKAGGKNSYFNMGNLPICGDGCAWNNNYATYTGTGANDFEVHGWADNSLTVGSVCSTCGGFTLPGDGSDDSTQYDFHVKYSGTWSHPGDFGLSGN